MAPQDTFFDDEDDTCPLCIEELDIQDRNFRPCPCGYQICQFCFNNIKNNINGLCPACRRPYDEKTIQWKVVTQEEIAEFRSNIQKNQKKRAAEQRQKEVQKREAEKENRKNLVGVRVVQKNLVYVTGLTPTVQEDELLKTLRKTEFFGQYGNIQKISISNRKSDGHNPSLGIYVTFERKEDAARCIQAVNGSQNGDRVLRAQLGTTKYCSAWLRHEVCSNRQCMFLHELGDEEDSYTRQDLSSLNSISTQTQRAPPSGAASSSSRSTSRQQGHPTPSQQYAQPMARSSSKDGSENGDGPALPPTANWARNPQVRSRRGSHATSGAAPSPAMSHSLPVTVEVPQETMEENRRHHNDNAPSSDNSLNGHSAAAADDVQVSAPAPDSDASPPVEEPQPAPNFENMVVVRLLKAMQDYSLRLPEFNTDYFPMFDVRGWEKRRAMREEEARAGLLHEEPQEFQESSEGEPDGSGSLALGGEPEDREPSRESLDYGRSTAQPPIQKSGAEGAFSPAIGSHPTSSYVGSVGGSRTVTPLQQGYMRANTGFGDHPPLGPPGLPQSQSSLFQNQGQAQAQGHNRQGSRFNFTNDNSSQSQSTTVKLAANPRLMAQQSSMMPSTFGTQQSGGPSFYGTTMQGPPPGLKSTGTPPNNMFGQNHGFGGSGFAAKDNNDLLQTFMRTRNNAGSGSQAQGHDAGKRELMFSSFPNQYPSSSTSSTLAPSVPSHNQLGQLYGNAPGASFQDFGSKQKKKGKKHRHANTSSGGGSALVDLADPSILQARMQQHQQQQSNAPFGGQSQDDDLIPSIDEAAIDALVSDEPMMPLTSSSVSMAGMFDRFIRPTTPAIPPGLGPIHVQASPAVSHASLQNSTVGLQTPPVLPVTPLKPPPGVPVLKKGVATPSTVEAKKSGKEVVKDSIKTMAVESGLSGDIANQAAKTKGKAVVLQEEDFPALNSTQPKTAPAAAPSTPSKKTATKPAAAASKKSADKQKEKEKTTEKVPENAAEKVSAEQTAEVVAAPPTTTTSEGQGKPSGVVKDKRPVPGILNIAAATTKPSQKTVETPGTTDLAKPTNESVKPGTDKESAFPALPTPTTAPVYSPVVRTAPKTLRVVSTVATPKTEAPPSAVPSLVRSASVNRPETPGSETISDSASIISAGMSQSRASSPPPSRVRTAPVRSTTKSQQRKARKEAVKKDVGVIVTAPKTEPDVEIAPIMGRKKKQKKEKVPASSSATPTVSRPETPVAEKPPPTPVKEAKETKDDSSTYRSVAFETMSLTEDTPPVRGKAADFKGKAKDGELREETSAFESEAQISPATVFRELMEDNYYPEGLDALNFIKPVVSSNDKHRHDQTFASIVAKDLLEKDLIEPQAKSIVQEEDQATLLEGRPVRKLVDGLRVMLTPYGDCVRNLTEEEEDRYLELQERVAEEAASPAVFVASRHEPSPGFSLIKGRAVPNGPPGYFPQALNAFPQDPVNKIQREEAIYYINQYVLPRLNLGTTGFPGPWKTAFPDGKVNLNTATANFNSTIAPYIDTAAPELSYPAPASGGSSLGLADSLPGHHQHNSHSQNLASVLVNSLGPWPEPHGGAGPSGAKFAGPTTSGGPFGSVPLMSMEDAEQALVAVRKETEKLEKQLNQKIKKNRQLLNIDLVAKNGMSGVTAAH